MKDREIFDHRNVANNTHKKINHWLDNSACRPELKAGWVLHITRKGHGHYNCVRTDLEVEAGDIMLFSPDAYLECRRADNSEEWFYSWILFQANELIDRIN
ncbi:AraC family ligand binding domain-containing protein [Endozoicomonas sp. OPT23]|uniref:AraC family ligand binding domain-containing protein n=1 Tax=Endozoicomonas sp. OPT23 TaxID=2072845 RepID=UPI001890DEA7|nr:AraC family ligand binding domain-containing protein [Endozoicomonas sp. OPT23]